MSFSLGLMSIRSVPNQSGTVLRHSAQIIFFSSISSIVLFVRRSFSINTQVVDGLTCFLFPFVRKVIFGNTNKISFLLGCVLSLRSMGSFAIFWNECIDGVYRMSKERPVEWLR